MNQDERTPLWVRAVADPEFREALIRDPLRAAAAHPEIAVTGQQIRRLEELDDDARRELVDDVVREIYRRRGPTSGSDHEVR